MERAAARDAGAPLRSARRGASPVCLFFPPVLIDFFAGRWVGSGPLLQTLTFEPFAGDLWAVLSELKERTAPGGGPWCPPHDAAAISRCIIDRTDDLGTNLQAVIRLVRLAALASPAGYVGFCYPKRLRSEVFRGAVEEAIRQGCLKPQFVAAGSNGVRLSNRGWRQAGTPAASKSRWLGCPPCGSARRSAQHARLCRGCGSPAADCRGP